MFGPIITQEDKKLIGHLSKKKKMAGKAHVYYNKKGTTSTSAYFTGMFYSKKNDTQFRYRSSYELKFYHMLEADKKVVNYLAEGFKVEYTDSTNKKRDYIPDLLVLYTDGSMVVYEVKPQEMLINIDVQKKAEACKKHIKANFGKNTSYKFITEKDLFPTPKDYTDFLKILKKNPNDFS